MPVEDLAWAIEHSHRLCDEHGLGCDAYPMHEVAAPWKCSGPPLKRPRSTSGMPRFSLIRHEVNGKEGLTYERMFASMEGR